MYRLFFPVLVACGSASATSSVTTTDVDPNFDRSVYDFPSREEVMALRRADGPDLNLFADVHQASEWVAVTPPNEATTLGEHESETPLGAKVVELAASRADLRATDAMECLAREIASVYAEHTAQPDAGYQRYLASRCGAIMPEVWTAGGSGTAPTEMSDQELWAAVQPTLDGLLTQLAELHDAHIGAHLVRREETVAYFVVAGNPKAQLAEVRPTADEAHRVHVRGRIDAPADFIGVAINRGAYGYEPCRLDTSIALPRIDATCRMDPDDSIAAIDVFALQRGRMLALPVASLLARHPGADGYVYRPTSGGNPVEVSTPADFAAQLVERVNAVRAAADLQPVVHAPAQSASISELAPLFFASRLAGDLETADRVGRAVMAGWDLDQPDVRDGAMSSGMVAGPSEPAYWLSSVLARPSARYALMNPEARILAVGAILGERGVAVLATSYERFADRDREADAMAIYERIAALRAARGVSAPNLVTQWQGLREHMDRVPTGKSPLEAMDGALEEAARAWQRDVHGLTLQAGDLRSFEVPAQLLEPGELYLVVDVTHRRPDDAPWAQYVIGIVFAR